MPKAPRKRPSSRATPVSAGAKSPRASTSVELESAAGPPTGIRVVGIGCSAGGLEALEKFFSHVAADTGLAYVVVQHLAPDHPSALPELLQRTTAMPVVEVSDITYIKADHVYVIPPNKDISLLNGVLHLLEPREKRGLRLPIDFFLRSLAEEQHERAIGVILSGMGSDGMFGLRAIKDKGGLTLVQEPDSASAGYMPRAAIEAGAADIVAPAEEIPVRIAAFLKHPMLRTADKVSDHALMLSDLDKIVILLRNRCGADFSLYKANTLVRRVERRIALHQIGGLTDYVRFLRENPQEIDLLFKELLIGVTSFFRDPKVWDFLEAEAIPALLARHPPGTRLRAWIPACSTGEEAYSLAIIFQEVQARVDCGARCELLIYATDLDPDAIEKARKGLYPANIIADVSAERLARFFVQEADGYRIRKQIRDMVVFATQNVTSDPPFTKLDILSCRNLLIYFRAELQRRLLPLFHYTLNRDGLLLLGGAETVGQFSHLFDPVNERARLFRKIDEAVPMTEVEFPALTTRYENPPVDAPLLAHTDNIGQLTDQLIQQSYAPAAVLVNGNGDILYISGRTGKYLEPPAGRVNVNIYAMARDGLREALTGTLHRALRDLAPICLKGIRVGTNGGTQIVDVIVQALDKPEPLRGRVLIVFQDVAAPPPRRRGGKSVAAESHDALLTELNQTREALQVTHEEMQSTVEELKSSNEELQSTNEELQSTNEELTTSKEELQSLNEELQTVNAELQSKVEDLTWVKNDMANLLNSTEIATIFLDNEMKLRRFTSHATQLFKLIPGDIGRPLSHVVTDLDYPQLKADAEEVLCTLTFQENQISTHDGRWYRVRIMPYRTQDNMIDGVVITFTDISEMKVLEQRLRIRRD